MSEYIDCIKIYGEVTMGLKRNNTELVRRDCQSPKTYEVLCFEILSNLTRLFLPKRCGGS